MIYSESRAIQRRPLDKAEEETAACVVGTQDLRAATCEQGMGDWNENFVKDRRGTPEEPGLGK